jgi:hypothetical protein
VRKIVTAPRGRRLHGMKNIYVFFAAALLTLGAGCSAAEEPVEESENVGQNEAEVYSPFLKCRPDSCRKTEVCCPMSQGYRCAKRRLPDMGGSCRIGQDEGLEE